MFKKFRYLVEYVLTLFLGVFIRVLSVRQAYALAAWLGRVGFFFGAARSVTMENLKNAFPEKTDEERTKIARAAYENFVATMIEILRLPLCDPRELVRDFQFEGAEHLGALLEKGKGVVACSGHFGNWEGMAAANLAHGYPIILMIGAQSNPYVDRLFNSYRQHCELSLLTLKDFRGIMAALKRNQVLALLGDQDGDRHGMFVDFLGRAASTFTGPAVFARKSGAGMIAAATVRQEPGKCLVKVVRLPDPPPGLSDEMDTYFRLKAYNQALGELIRQHPEQWWWMHKRWEARPEHRLSGELRKRAETGEIYFDVETQRWKEKDSGKEVQIPGQKADG